MSIVKTEWNIANLANQETGHTIGGGKPLRAARFTAWNCNEASSQTAAVLVASRLELSKKPWGCMFDACKAVLRMVSIRFYRSYHFLQLSRFQLLAFFQIMISYESMSHTGYRISPFFIPWTFLLMTNFSFSCLPTRSITKAFWIWWGSPTLSWMHVSHRLNMSSGPVECMVL